MALVVDTGSGVIKAGFAGDDDPSAVFPSVVGRERDRLNESKSSSSGADCFGSEALEANRRLSLSYPMEHGIVANWDDMEKLLHYTFGTQMRVATEDYPILLTEAPLNPKANREKLTQIMFEKFGSKSLYVARQNVLAMYGAARVSAITVDCGDGVTHVAPIYEGYPQPEAIRRMDVGGRDMTAYLSHLLQEKGYSFSTTAEQEIVRGIKEKLCYTALDYDKEMMNTHNSSTKESEYRLPDGSTVTLNSERFKAAECLFRPSLLGLNIQGIDEMIHSSIMSCGIDIRPVMLYNVVPLGGCTLSPGFADRLNKEMRRSFSEKLMLKVRASPEREYSVWIGGSVLASLNTFQQMWISKEDYYEYGPSIIHRKCY